MSEGDKHKGEKINGRGIESVGKGGYTLNTEVREAFKKRQWMVEQRFREMRKRSHILSEGKEFQGRKNSK